VSAFGDVQVKARGYAGCLGTQLCYKASALQPNKKAISSKKKDEIRRVNIVEEMR
jgi:hypothetical protein